MYHWQLVEVKQLLDEASEHVLTLPHLIQGPESKNELHQERKKYSVLLCFFEVHLSAAWGTFVSCAL